MGSKLSKKSKAKEVDQSKKNLPEPTPSSSSVHTSLSHPNFSQQNTSIDNISVQSKALSESHSKSRPSKPHSRPHRSSEPHPSSKHKKSSLSNMSKPTANAHPHPRPSPNLKSTPPNYSSASLGYNHKYHSDSDFHNSKNRRSDRDHRLSRGSFDHFPSRNHPNPNHTLHSYHAPHHSRQSPSLTHLPQHNRFASEQIHLPSHYNYPKQNLVMSNPSLVSMNDPYRMEKMKSSPQFLPHDASHGWRNGYPAHPHLSPHYSYSNLPKSHYSNVPSYQYSNRPSQTKHSPRYNPHASHRKLLNDHPTSREALSAYSNKSNMMYMPKPEELLYSISETREISSTTSSDPPTPPDRGQERYTSKRVMKSFPHVHSPSHVSYRVPA